MTTKKLHTCVVGCLEKDYKDGTYYYHANSLGIQSPKTGKWAVCGGYFDGVAYDEYYTGLRNKITEAITEAILNNSDKIGFVNFQDRKLVTVNAQFTTEELHQWLQCCHDMISHYS